MSDPNDSPAIPTWQRTQSDDAPTTSEVDAPATESQTATPETTAETQESVAEPQGTVVESQEDSLDVARRFLDDEAVRHAPREKKVAFLQSKNIDQRHIEQLLGPDETPISSQSTTESTSSPTPTQTIPLTPIDRPPIVTYPEFLAKPTRPPPLVTTSRLINTLYAVAGLSTLVYGTGHFLVSPMIDSQTEARVEFHDVTTRKLDALVAKLEKSVSQVPPKKTTAEEDSDAEDPTEMFHKDMGTQTSSPLVTTTTKDASDESLAQQHTDRLSGLSKSLSSIKDEYRSQSEGMDGIKTAVDVLRDDLDSLTYGSQADYLGGYDIYGSARKNEPDDEIRKVRDSIRRVKGVLLSTRNFPVSTR